LGETERCQFCYPGPNRAKVALHRLRHGRKVALQLLEEFDRRLEWSRWKLKLCEKLLYVQWHKLWSLPTHNYHQRALDNFFKWFREYYENLYPHTVNLQHALSRLVDQNFYDYVPRKFYKVDVTEPLKEFNYQLDQILKIITLIRDVALSNATKAEKDYWLRQIRQATELEGIRTGYDYGRGELIGHYERQTLVLNFEEKINDVKEKLDHSYQDVYAELTAKEDHGWYTILELDSKTEAGMKMLVEDAP